MKSAASCCSLEGGGVDHAATVRLGCLFKKFYVIVSTKGGNLKYAFLIIKTKPLILIKQVIKMIKNGGLTSGF